MNRGIYIHIPFCVRKCAYCDFYSLGGVSEEIKSVYTDALIKHMEMSQDKALFCDSLYLGGGTPSLMDVRDIERIIGAARHNFTLSEDCEITLEANPGTVDKQKFSDLLSAGVNRISLGVQSLNDRELLKLGRLHDAYCAREAIESAFWAGFENVSCDVMFGIPYQTYKSLVATLSELCTYQITHVSAYGLKLEASTPLALEMDLALPDEDKEREMYFDIVSRLGKCGFNQYEISNFARGGKVSRHNIKYWRGDEYISFGPAAAGYLHGERYTYTRDIKSYITAVQNKKNIPEAERYAVSDSEKREEKIIFGLRMTDGIRLSDCGIISADIKKSPVLSRLLMEEYMSLDGEILCLTPKGFYISNSIINELLEL